MTVTWEIKTIALKDLKPHPKNPRYITKEQAALLEDLIDKFGLIEKPIVNWDMTIIGGHQRLKILKKRKFKEVECWVPDRALSLEEINRLCIGLNLNQGAFDYDILANEFNAIDLINWGFTEEQLVGKFEELIEEIDERQEKKAQSKKCTCPSCGFEF